MHVVENPSHSSIVISPNPSKQVLRNFIQFHTKLNFQSLIDPLERLFFVH